MASSYPGALDTFVTRTDGQTIAAQHMNDVQNAVSAVQGELGATPSGSFATVAERLDSLGTGTVADGAITAAKVADGAITAAKVADGAITAAKVAGDVATQAELDAVAATVAVRAPLASPAFTGNPTAPTPPPGDNDTSIATTAFVTAAVSAINAWTLTVKANAYTALANDFILADATAGGFTITLPTAPATGRSVGVKKTDASSAVVTVVGGAGTTIDGDPNATLVSRRAGAVFTYDGSNWQITGVTR